MSRRVRFPSGALRVILGNAIWPGSQCLAIVSLVERTLDHCPKCGATEGIKFRTRNSAKQGKLVCRTCESQHSARYYSKNRERLLEAQRVAHKDNPAPGILRDSRKGDLRAGRENDLDIPFIEGLIRQDCLYCGETTVRMTLDRIDNSLGHLKSNVLPSCVRCNLVRGNMPYEAWLHVAKGMRSAREIGLFSNWAGVRVGCKRKV